MKNKWRKRNAEQAEMPKNVEERVHQNITCDGCSTSPIVGIRYKCAECPNFDLCSKCEENGVHEEHTFLKVKIPQGIQVHQPFRTEESPWQRRRGCHGKRNRQGKRHHDVPEAHSEDEQEPVIEEEDTDFKYKEELSRLKELGIDVKKAKDALLKNNGDFDIACSVASRETVPKEEPKEEQKEVKKDCHGRKHHGKRGGCRGKREWGPDHFGGPFGGFGGHHGPHGHHGGPMKHMIQEFLNQLVQNGASSGTSDSEEENDRVKRRQEQRKNRPAIIQTSDMLYSVAPGETVIVDVTVENKTRWPCMIESIKKIEPSEISFEGLEVGQKLKFSEQSKLSIPITMPSQPGHFAVKLGFFSKKGQTGEVLNLEFDVEGQ